ncbi:hypothetical protein RI129_007752 [Pyrocoelia pectoralis]|uniref:Uncharacterized protein n=1 Tax=Pyrocoelia pectoralis TaxID=417401 RepID=A0AAN7ZHA4_9COLE
MVGVLETITNQFWNKNFWLPDYVTWEDLEPGFRNNIKYSNPKDLYLAIPFAFGMVAIRYCLERYCFTPIGTLLEIKNCISKPAKNPLLEKAFISQKKISNADILKLAKQLDWPERKVERWFRLRPKQNKPSTMNKFCENSWLSLYCISMFIMGITALWNKSWMWNIKECWISYPHHNIDDDIWWYYIISLSQYCSLCLTTLIDVRRKDFHQVLIHHTATISLLIFSWFLHLQRIGSLLIFIHESSEIFLNVAKIARYAEYSKVCDTMFVMFTLVWIITRLCIFPFWIIKSTLFDSLTLTHTSPFPVYYIFNSFLIIILALDLFWTYLIVKVLNNYLKKGHVERDARSSSSTEDSS